jgi:hypothetical protein
MARSFAALAAAALTLILASSPVLAAECLLRITAGDDVVRFDDMAPGQSRHWTLSVRNVGDRPVTAVLALDASGALASALAFRVRSCEAPWTDGGFLCTGQSRDLGQVLTGPSGQKVAIGLIPAGSEWHGRFTATMHPDAGDEFQGAEATASAVVTAQSSVESCQSGGGPDGEGPDGEGPEPGPSGPVSGPGEDHGLASTGRTHGPALLAGLGMLTMGALLRLRQPRRTPPSARSGHTLHR